MIVIGLTGSIGMGKSTAAEMLSRMGLPVHDSDAEVHRLLGRDGAAVPMVGAMFPETHDKVWRKIDRAKLGAIVFKDPQALADLESVLHPMVRAAQSRFLRAARRRGAKAAVLDVPLLFETGSDLFCDFTICVSAPYFLQRQRVLARGLPEEEFHRRLTSQMSDHEKRLRADFTVQTGLGMAYSRRALQKIVREIVHDP